MTETNKATISAPCPIAANLKQWIKSVDLLLITPNALATEKSSVNTLETAATTKLGIAVGLTCDPIVCSSKLRSHARKHNRIIGKMHNEIERASRHKTAEELFVIPAFALIHVYSC